MEEHPGHWILRHFEWNQQPRLLFGGHIPFGESPLEEGALIERATQIMEEAADVMGYSANSLTYERINRHLIPDRKPRVIVGFSHHFDDTPVEAAQPSSRSGAS